MRWDNIPIARINNTYRDKILKKVADSNKKWYGYTNSQWIEAFNAKKLAEEQVYVNNIKAAQAMAQKRRRKEYENNRAVSILLYNICKAAHL